MIGSVVAQVALRNSSKHIQQALGLVGRCLPLLDLS